MPLKGLSHRAPCTCFQLAQTAKDLWPARFALGPQINGKKAGSVIYCPDRELGQ